MRTTQPTAGGQLAGWVRQRTDPTKQPVHPGPPWAGVMHNAPTASPNRIGHGLQASPPDAGWGKHCQYPGGRARLPKTGAHHPDVSNGPCVEARCNGEAYGTGAIGDVERWPACGTTADHRDGRPRRTSRGLADSRSDSSPWSRPCARTTASRPAAAVAMPIATIFSVYRSANAATLTAFHRVRRPQAPGPNPGSQLCLLGRDHPGTPPCDANAQRVLPLSAPGGAHAPAWPGIAPPFTASAPATLP